MLKTRNICVHTFPRTEFIILCLFPQCKKQKQTKSTAYLGFDMRFHPSVKKTRLSNFKGNSSINNVFS